MKKVFKSTRLFAYVLALGCSLGLVSCDDDDDPLFPTDVTTETMWGNYDGKMVSYVVSAEKEDNVETPAGIDVTAKVANDTIYFENFPIKDIVMSVVGNETVADKIVEAVGDVPYKIGYKPELAKERDNIYLTLDPKPLKLSVAVPASKEGEEPQSLQIEVKVEAGEGAKYDVEGSNLKFYFGATEVLLGEGESQQKLPGFLPTTFHFDMNQHKVAHMNF